MGLNRLVCWEDGDRSLLSDIWHQNATATRLDPFPRSFSSGHLTPAWKSGFRVLLHQTDRLATTCGGRRSADQRRKGGKKGGVEGGGSVEEEFQVRVHVPGTWLECRPGNSSFSLGSDSFTQGVITDSAVIWSASRSNNMEQYYYWFVFSSTDSFKAIFCPFLCSLLCFCA